MGRHCSGFTRLSRGSRGSHRSRDKISDEPKFALSKNGPSRPRSQFPFQNFVCVFDGDFSHNLQLEWIHFRLADIHFQSHAFAFFNHPDKFEGQFGPRKALVLLSDQHRPRLARSYCSQFEYPRRTRPHSVFDHRQDRNSDSKRYDLQTNLH